MQHDISPFWVNLLAFRYWIYLLDPFKSNPQTRRYRSLIKTHRILIIQLTISSIFALLAIYRISIGSNRDIFSFIPLLFIILVLIFNNICRAKYGRDFYLILRGDRLKTIWFDKVASLFILIVPIGINFGICLSMKRI